jgi:hypothetical protein
MKAPLHSFGTQTRNPDHLLHEEMTMNRRYTIAESNTNRQPRVWLTASRSSRGAVETTASTGTRHRRRVAQLVVLATLVLAGAVLGRQPPAHAAPRVTGLELVYDVSDSNSRSPKYAFAKCPFPKKVVGGGANALYAEPTPFPRLVLTRSVPYEFESVSAFRAAAVEGGGGFEDNWYLVAYAICADPLPGYHIVHSINDPSSEEVQTAEAKCPSGRHALGAGAEILAPDHPHGVGLQVVRASGNGDLTRAQAHEQPQGYRYDWQLVASAICADTPEGYQVRYGESEERESEPTKNAVAYCDEGTQVTGAGAAISNVEPGHVALYSFYPNAPGVASLAAAQAAEITPLQEPWDFIVAQAICVAK